MKLRARIRRFILSCSLISIVASAVFVLPLPTLHAADPVGWEDLGLYGGQINDIALDPEDPNIMFVGTHQGDGLFKSTNGGATWESVEGFKNESVKSIALDPQDYRTIWVATYSYIYKSEDGGLTWQEKLNWSEINRCFYSLVIDPLNSSTI